MQPEIELKSAREQMEQNVRDLNAELLRLHTLLKAELDARIRAEDQIRARAPLLDMTSDAMIACDLDGRISFWNPSAARMYEWNVESVVGRLLPELLYPHDPTRFSANVASVIANQAYRGEERQMNKSGQVVFVQSSWTLIRNPQGKDQVLIVSTDITEHKELERQFFRVQRLETVGLLASGIAHDLNNVLAPILMASQNLLNEINEEGHRELLRSIEASARRGGALVHQVLSFARGAEGERAPLDLKQLLHEFQKVAKDTFPRSIQLVSQFGKNLRPVLGNRTQLYQAIMNLCLNSRDAMPNGGILQIEATNVFLDEHFVSRHPPAPPGDYLVLRISDNGVGIPEAVIDKIFDPFFTTKESGKGTGLGLSTVLGIVKRHHGFLDVTSKVGKGTRFTIYLPTIDPVDYAGTTDIVPALPTGDGKLILVVDDERVMRDITASTLKKNGYQILTASDGTEGFALFTQNREQIAAVVTDMSMPYMDGAKMIRALLQIDPKAKIIAVSGLNEEVNLPDALRKRIPFLKKPFTVEDLLETLHQALLNPPGKVMLPRALGRR